MTRRRLVGAMLALAVAAGGVFALIGSASGAPAMNRASTTCAKNGYDGRYWRRQVDPIVAPGQPASAHLHDFFGIRNISSTLSAAGIQAAAPPAHADDPGYGPFYSNCPFYGDWPAYWFPSPFFNGTLITSGKLTNTWQAPAGVHVTTPPFGEAVVTGSASAATTSPHIRFTCGSLDEPGYDKPTDCTSVPGGVVTAEATFPDCWDGFKTFDSPAGISPSHFSYSVNGACPAGSVPCTPGQLIAQLVTQQTFIDPRTSLPMTNPNNADGTLGLSFSSGPYYTYHADYLNLWNHYLDAIVQQCLNNGGPCPFGTRVGLHNLE